MKLTDEQMIEHIILNVPNMAKFCYSMYFGTPPPELRTSIAGLKAHARKILESDFLNIEVLYSDVEGNEELVLPLPESLK